MIFAVWLFIGACSSDSQRSSTTDSEVDASVAENPGEPAASAAPESKALSGTPSLETPVWEQRTSPPGGRYGSAATYDGGRKRTLLFGGERQDGTQGDTWEWDGALWALRATTGPSARAYATVAFDPLRNTVVLFGGERFGTTLGDTWEWDGFVWKEVCAGSCASKGPSARSRHMTVWDPKSKTVIVFGGKGQGGHLNDTWGWDGNRWVELAKPQSSPKPRERAGMTWDVGAGNAVLFGGNDGVSHFNDTWAWNGEEWTLRASSGPSPRAGVALFYDDASEKVTIFGGADSTPVVNYSDETWKWDNASSSWSSTAHPVRPLARREMVTAFDAERRRVVLFGGGTISGAVGDTWEWDGVAWIKIEAYPDARKGFRLAYDPGSGKTLLFGGQLGWGAANDLWGFGGTRWTRLCTAPSCASTAAPGRGDQAMAFDDVRGRLIVYGGGAAGTIVHDLWEFSGTAWERKCASAPCTMPPMRWYPGSGAFDSDRRRFVVFGGWLGGTDFGDTWEWDGASWVEKCTSSPCKDTKPSNRSRVAMAYDSIGKKTLLFGGSGASGWLTDIWEWDGNVWREKCTTAECRATTPELNEEATLAFDSVRNRVVLVAGGLTWEWDGGRWAFLPSVKPGYRVGTQIAFDSDRQRVVLFGGHGLDDTWEYHTRGGTCRVSTDCSTGFCVDGVCCDSIACGMCQACNLPSNPGVCSSVTDGDDPDSCFGANTCDALGRCRQKNGGSCFDDINCASGFCVDNHCCDSACSGGCDVCNAVPGKCTVRAKGSVGENPGCGGFLCDGTSGSCPGTCQIDNDCAANFFCAAGGICQPRRFAGSSCNTQTGGNCNEAGCRECQGGLTCKDGYCCTSECSGTCQTCAATPGDCTPVKGTDDGDTCTGVSTCDVTGQCKAKNGETCGLAGQCASGNCVDGVCCDTPCAGGCDVCNVNPGVCTVVAQGHAGASPSCGAFVCNGSSPLCPTICANDADCAEAHFCGTGGICQPRKAQGLSCNASAGADCNHAGCRVCQSGFCVDGFCCDGACGSACDACNGATLGWEGAIDGTCSVAPAGHPGSPSCITYACDGTSASCASSCESDVECGPGHYCSTSGTCLPQKLQGQSCDLATDCKTPGDCRQCETGNCVGGYCCNSPCSGQCETCSVTPGVCSPRAAGTVGEPSCAPFFCNGISASCDDTCETDTQCAPEHHCLEGTCHLKKELGESCDTDRQCGTTAYCEEASSTCVAKAALGDACDVGKGCLSGFCVDGYCCDQACGGQCEACDVGTAKGKCSPVVGKPHGARPACASGSGESGDGLCEARACDGSKSTASCVGYVGAEVACRDRSCEAGEETFSATCNGQGQCGPSGATKTRSCEPYACGETSCKSECKSEDDCAAGYSCNGASGKCIAGATCDGDHIVTAPGQPPTDCRPYKCEAGGTCKASCASIDDCVEGFVCDLDNHCAAATYDADTVAESGGCGCRVAGGAEETPHGKWLAFTLIGLVGARLGRRRGARAV